MRRRYSDREKAAALAALTANGGNVARTARELGIPCSTLERWAAGDAISADVPELREEKTAELADRLEAIAHQLVDAIPGKIAGADLQRVAVTLGITVDKMRLLREQPTEITANLSDDERAQRVAELLDRARARRDGRPPIQAN